MTLDLKTFWVLWDKFVLVCTNKQVVKEILTTDNNTQLVASFSFPELFLWAEKFPFVSSEPGMLSPAFKHDIIYFSVFNCASYTWIYFQKGLNKFHSKN